MKKISVSVVVFLCLTFLSGMSFGQGLPQVHTKIDIKKIDLGHFSREQGPKFSRGLTSEKQVRDLCNQLLEDKLGDGFVEEHLKYIGIQRLTGVDLFRVAYRFSSNGYHLDMFLSFDPTGRFIKNYIDWQSSFVMHSPQEINISKQQAISIAREADPWLKEPFYTRLDMLSEKDNRIVWIVIGADKVSFAHPVGVAIDAENGNIIKQLFNTMGTGESQDKKSKKYEWQFINFSSYVAKSEQGKFASYSVYIGDNSSFWADNNVDFSNNINVGWSLFGYNFDSSSHKLYFKVFVIYPDGTERYWESDHLVVYPGYYISYTSQGYTVATEVGEYTYRVELWEDIPFSPDIRRDKKYAAWVAGWQGRTVVKFSKPFGVSNNYYVDDKWHHPSDPWIEEFALEEAAGATSVREAVKKLADFVHEDMTYDESYGARSTDTSILTGRRGDCNDFADLYIGLARSLNIPSRPVVIAAFETYPTCDPGKGSVTNLGGIFCNPVNFYWGHAVAESYYYSNNYGSGFHHVDPTWGKRSIFNDILERFGVKGEALIEHPEAYGEGSCVSQVIASAYTGAYDNYNDKLNGDELGFVNGWINVTGTTDDGYDWYRCVLDSDNDGICDNEDPTPCSLTCDASHLNLCTTQVDCTGAGGYWCNDQCQANPCPVVCDANHPNLCVTEAECTDAGLNWCNGACQVAACPAQSCDASHLNLCTTQVDCTGAGGYWCNDQCQAIACINASPVLDPQYSNGTGSLDPTVNQITIPIAQKSSITIAPALNVPVADQGKEVNLYAAIVAGDTLYMAENNLFFVNWVPYNGGSIPSLGTATLGTTQTFNLGSLPSINLMGWSPNTYDIYYGYVTQSDFSDFVGTSYELIFK